MNDPFEEEVIPINDAIVNELIALTPEWWHAIVLDVTYSIESDTEGYEHVISSPEGHREPIMPSDRLFELTYELGQLFRRYSRHWTAAKYTVQWQEGEIWNSKANFTY